MCRGKLLNVRDASVTQINGNAEIDNIKKILGLQHGKVGICAQRAGHDISCEAALTVSGGELLGLYALPSLCCWPSCMHP
jgi:hypothetical protein